MAVRIKSDTGFIDYDEYVGDTVNIVLDYRTAPKPDGQQINLTGSVISIEVRESQDDELPLLTLTTGNGLVVGGTTNNIVGTISNTQTTTLGAGKFRYFVKHVDSLGKVNTLITGKIKLRLR